MLTRENDMEVHALHKRGWTISAIWQVPDNRSSQF